MADGKAVGTLVFLFGCVLISVLIWESRYKAETPPAVRQRHAEMSIVLGGLSRGDFIELDGGEMAVVSRHSADRREIGVRYHPGADLDYRSCVLWARRVKGVVRSSEEGWCDAARKFLTAN